MLRSRSLDMKMWNQIVIQFLSARSDAYRAVTHLPGCWILCSWCVLWQSSESAGSPVTPREAWMSISGPFARLPAPPHITGDVSLSVSLTLNWFLQTASFTQSAVCIHTYSLYLYCIHTLMWLMGHSSEVTCRLNRSELNYNSLSVIWIL